jgi:hypothetical protein
MTPAKPPRARKSGTRIVRVPKVPSPGAWLTNSALLVHAVRVLCQNGATLMLEVTRGPRTGELEIARGLLTSARVERLVGQDAFNHMLMWDKITFTTHPLASQPRATLGKNTDVVLEVGRAFVDQLDLVADIIGGPRSTLIWDAIRLAELAHELPPAVRALAAGISPGASIADVVAQSAFSPSDGLKICHRLCELGVFVVRDAMDEAPSLASQLAMVDWMLQPKSKKARGEPTLQTRLRPRRITRSDASYDELDRSFFARSVEIERGEPVDQFEDLEDTERQRRPHSKAHP